TTGRLGNNARMGDCRRTIRWWRRIMPPRVRSWRNRWGWGNSGGGASNRAGGCSSHRQAGTSVGADPVHHGTQAVRALRRKMLAQAHAIEKLKRVGRQDLARRLAREESEQDGDQTAHDMGVAVADKGQD